MLKNRLITATVTATTTAAVALSLVTAPAHAATLSTPDEHGACKVTFTEPEKQFFRAIHDDTESIMRHEKARDQIIAIETVYPQLKTLEKTLGQKDKETLAALGMPAPLIEHYLENRATFANTKPTTNVTLEDIDVDSEMVNDSRIEGAPAPIFPGELDKQLLDDLFTAWAPTPSGKLNAKLEALSLARAQARNACQAGKPKTVAYPTLANFRSDKGPETTPNVGVIIGGVIATLLAIAGVIAALPLIGVKLPF